MTKGIAILIISAVLSAEPVFGGGIAESLQLVLDVSKGSYIPYEPVIITYSLQNVSSDSQTVPNMIDPSLGWVRFEIAATGGSFQRFRTGIQASTIMEYVTLRPGDRLTSEIVMLTNSYAKLARMDPIDYKDVELFPFAAPGRYSIRASYPLMREQGDSNQAVLRSKTVEINVVASDIPQRAMSFFGNLEAFAAAMGTDSPSRDPAAGLSRWEDFIHMYPDGPYSPFVAFNLAQRYIHGTGLPNPDPARAAELCKFVVEKAPRALVDDALLRLAEQEVNLGQFDAAGTTVERLLRDYPASEQALPATRLRNGLAKGYRSLKEIYSH